MTVEPTALSPRVRPVQARSRARWERILDVTTELIVEHGVDAVTVAEIARSAQVSVPSLYRYFPDKAAIIAAIAERYRQVSVTCVQGCFAVVSRPDDLAPAVSCMLDGYFDFMQTAPGGRAIWRASGTPPLGIPTR